MNILSNYTSKISGNLKNRINQLNFAILVGFLSLLIISIFTVSYYQQRSIKKDVIYFLSSANPDANMVSNKLIKFNILFSKAITTQKPEDIKLLEDLNIGYFEYLVMAHQLDTDTEIVKKAQDILSRDNTLTPFKEDLLKLYLEYKISSNSLDKEDKSILANFVNEDRVSSSFRYYYDLILSSYE